jgi:hypothetical protein
MQLKQLPEVNEDLIRHMILSSIKRINTKFRKEYGQVVVATEGRNVWRKKVFPYYKANRKKDRDASPIDWESVYVCLNKIRDELKEHFPYKVINVDTAEADDIIACLCHRFGTTLNNAESEKIIIVSGDGDFCQLQKYANVEQYAPVSDKFLKIADPAAELKELVIRGDPGDGVPNILMEDSFFILKEKGQKQKSITQKKLVPWMEQDPELWGDDLLLKRFRRNETLVDLNKVPEEINKDVIDQFDNYVVPKRAGLLNYFIKNKLKILMESINEF